jgi:hypothetical protein
MKVIISLFLLLPLAGFAQECSYKKLVDKFSQETYYSSGFMNYSGVKGEKISFSIEADSKEVRLLFSLPGNCFNDQSTAVISFDGSKSKSTSKNSTAMNCDGIFTAVFRNTATTPFALQKVASQKLHNIIFTGSNGQKVELLLKAEEKDLLLERASCIVNEAKALIR